MPKYKVEHYESKIRRHFDPLISEQELLVKQFKTEATKRIVGKLSKKMGADKILDAFKKAEEQKGKHECSKKEERDMRTAASQDVQEHCRRDISWPPAGKHTHRRRQRRSYS